MASDLNVRPDLVELVKNKRFIYDLKHKDYKNKARKAIAWAEIAEKLNIEEPRARELWRTLRDGYIRYKKALRRGKQSIYGWSEHLSFLDGCIAESDNNQERPQPACYSEDAYGRISLDSSEIPIERWEESVASSPRQDNDSESMQVIQPKSRTSRKRKEDAMDLMIEYLQTKKAKKLDSVDYLFMSYAKTFKSLNPRKQAILKVTLAKVFAEAEFGDLSKAAADK